MLIFFHSHYDITDSSIFKLSSFYYVNFRLNRIIHLFLHLLCLKRISKKELIIYHSHYTADNSHSHYTSDNFHSHYNPTVHFPIQFFFLSCVDFCLIRITHTPWLFLVSAECQKKESIISPSRYSPDSSLLKSYPFSSVHFLLVRTNHTQPPEHQRENK